MKKPYNFRRYPVKDFRFEVNVLDSFGEKSICSEKMKKKKGKEKFLSSIISVPGYCPVALPHRDHRQTAS